MCCRQFKRRDFLGLSTGILAGAGVASSLAGGAPTSAGWPPERWDPSRPFRVTGKKLVVQPILMYAVSRKREAASWKSWGGVQTEEAAEQERGRIAEELRELAGNAGFPLEILPAVKVRAPAEARRQQRGQDVTLVYAATGSGELLRGCVPDQGHAIIFVRHRSGPVYYWYEALSTRYLAKGPRGRTGHPNRWGHRLPGRRRRPGSGRRVLPHRGGRY